MIDFSDVKVKIEKESKGHAVVRIWPLPRGYGNTLGNALRRALISSIDGAAITSIKVDGAQHEYSTIDGMLEDVFNFILNLRGVAFINHSDDPQTVRLDVKGIKDITAGDIDVTQDIEIANPDYVIAHLTKKNAHLKVEMVVEKGVGFEFADDTKRSEAGVIPVGANFSPIKKVGYKVNDVRVGQRTDFNEVVLELDMKENITAKDAIHQASRMIADGYVRIIKALGEVYEDENVVAEDYEIETVIKVEEEEKSANGNGNGVDMSKVKIEELHVSARVVRSLYDQGIETVDQLLDHTEEEIRAFKGMGAASVRELKEALDKLGVSLKE